jgi:cell division protein FtsQ
MKFGWSRRPRNRRRENGSAWKLGMPRIDWQRAGILAASLAAMVAALGLIVFALDQSIRTVAVEGRFQRVSPVDVEQAVKHRLLGAGLVTVQLAQVRRAIQTIPWVDTATVQRVWPRGLRVFVVEQVAAARWGENGLLNTRGELFMSEARHIPPELPRLSGPPGTEAQVAQRYFALQGRLVEAGMRLTAVRLDARGAWEFDLDNGVTARFGRRQLDERIERFFASALKLISQRSQEISYIDLRYTNGFAVGWKMGGARLAAGATGPEDDDSHA